MLRLASLSLFPILMLFCNISTSRLVQIPDLEVVGIAADTVNPYYKALQSEGKKQLHIPEIYRIAVKNNTSDTMYLFSQDSVMAAVSMVRYFEIKEDSIFPHFFSLQDYFTIKFVPIFPHQERTFIILLSPMEEDDLARISCSYSKRHHLRDSTLHMIAFFTCENSLVTGIYSPPFDFKDRVFFEGKPYYLD